MRKDIEIPEATNVYIVAKKEWDQEFCNQDWNIYVINDREDEISLVLVMSRGKSETQKTSTLRQNIGTMLPKSSVKIELIMPEVLSFTNEYLITFFAENKLFERKFTFDPNQISEENTMELPVLGGEGVLAK